MIVSLNVRLPSTDQSIGYDQCSWGPSFAVPDTIDPVTLGAFITCIISYLLQIYIKKSLLHDLV